MAYKSKFKARRKAKEWYWENRDRILNDRKNLSLSEKERRKEIYRKWQKAHKKHLISYNKRYNKQNETKRKQERDGLRYRVINFYGGNPPRCACCGEKEILFLTIDHINNDGAEHRKKINSVISRWIIKNNFPKGFQILCYNCNMAKSFYKKCPHIIKSKKVL